MHSIVPIDTLVTSRSPPTRITGALIGPHTSAIDTADPTLSCIRTVTCITICLQLSTRESDTTCKNLLGSQQTPLLCNMDYSNLIPMQATLSFVTCTKADQGAGPSK